MYSCIGCLNIDVARDVYHELCCAQSCLSLNSDLHLLFLAVSRDLASSVEPNWSVYLDTVSMWYVATTQSLAFIEREAHRCCGTTNYYVLQVAFIEREVYYIGLINIIWPL